MGCDPKDFLTLILFTTEAGIVITTLGRRQMVKLRTTDAAFISVKTHGEMPYK